MPLFKFKALYMNKSVKIQPYIVQKYTIALANRIKLFVNQQTTTAFFSLIQHTF